MSKFFTPRNLAITGGICGLVFFWPASVNKTTNPFQTQGSQNIADRWSAGGGSDNHTPGAATRRGDSASVDSPQINPKGIKSLHYQENVISQRPGEPGTFDKAWNQANYGQDKGK